MTFIERYLPVWSLANETLSPKMIFIAGPRQCGKTTLIENFLVGKNCEDLFFNWDTPKVRDRYRKDPTFFESIARLTKKQHSETWVGFDEIHKRIKWKNILKGYFDQFGKEFRFAVTGSTRLDLFRKSSDALIGRYFLFHLFPFSLSEIAGRKYNDLKPWHALLEKGNWTDIFEHASSVSAVPIDLWRQLYDFGPFPEPLLKGDKTFSNLWHQDYLSLYLREELRDLTRISDIDGVESLVRILPKRIGSILSINSLKEDLQVSHATVKGWLESLQKLYLIFSISPWQIKIHKSIKKEKKYYFYDWFYVPETDHGPRFENMVAVGLKHLCNCLRENGAGDYGLFFIRDLAKRKVDFLIAKGEKPVMLVEAKNRDLKISGFTLNLSNKLDGVPILQLVNTPNVLKKISANAWIMSANHFFSAFP
jgi:predicted AAA+ superfamily ATPase